MSKRFQNALDIQAGACNPSVIAQSIVDACKDIRNEDGDTNTIRSDPAVRLMVHQLAYLMNIDEINHNLSSYSELSETCKNLNRR